MTVREDFGDPARAVVQVLSEDGWTCEYHEPDPRCPTCAKAHGLTADRIMEALRVFIDDEIDRALWDERKGQEA